MKKLLFVAIAFAGLALVSCNKNQSAVKKLDGTWNATSSTTTSGSITIDNLNGGSNSIQMTFNECKLKDDEWCTGSVMTTIGSLSYTDDQVYRVTGDGMTLETKEDEASTTVSTSTIDELTKTTLKITTVDGNSTTVTEAEKQ